MGNKRFKSRVRRMAQKSFRSLWIPILAIAVWIAAFIVGVIWDAITGKYIGNPALSAIENFIQNLDLAGIIQWIISHPAEASATWFFTTLSIILIRVYLETRDTKGLSVGRAMVSGAEKRNGVRVTNRTGYNLYNCTIALEKIDGKVQQDRLRWGYQTQDYNAEILEGEGANFRMQQISGKVAKVVGEEPYGEDIEAEFIFRYNSEGTDKVESLPIYVSFRLEEQTINNNTFHGVVVTKIET